MSDESLPIIYGIAIMINGKEHTIWTNLESKEELVKKIKSLKDEKGLSARLVETSATKH